LATPPRMTLSYPCTLLSHLTTLLPHLLLYLFWHLFRSSSSSLYIIVGFLLLSAPLYSPQFFLALLCKLTCYLLTPSPSYNVSLSSLCVTSSTLFSPVGGLPFCHRFFALLAFPSDKSQLTFPGSFNICTCPRASLPLFYLLFFVTGFFFPPRALCLFAFTVVPNFYPSFLLL